MGLRHLRKVDFVRGLLFLAIVLCGLYVLVGILMAFGAYTHLGAVDPILIITYVSTIHIIALPLLFIAITTTCGKPVCYIIFLVLNALFILGLVIAVIVLSVKVNGEQYHLWSSNPLNHILITVYLFDACLLELLVGLYYRDLKREIERKSPHTPTSAPEPTTVTTTSIVTDSRGSSTPPTVASPAPPPPPPPSLPTNPVVPTHATSAAAPISPNERPPIRPPRSPRQPPPQPILGSSTPPTITSPAPSGPPPRRHNRHHRTSPPTTTNAPVQTYALPEQGPKSIAPPEPPPRIHHRQQQATPPPMSPVVQEYSPPAQYNNHPAPPATFQNYVQVEPGQYDPPPPSSQSSPIVQTYTASGPSPISPNERPPMRPPRSTRQPSPQPTLGSSKTPTIILPAPPEPPPRRQYRQTRASPSTSDNTPVQNFALPEQEPTSLAPPVPPPRRHRRQQPAAPPPISPNEGPPIRPPRSPRQTPPQPILEPTDPTYQKFTE